MTIQDLHDSINDNTEEYIDFDTFAETLIGKKVYYLEYNPEGHTHWSNRTYTITSYDNNLCGSGCCTGFCLEGDMYYWSNQLKLVNCE